MPFRFERLAIPDVVLVEPRTIADNRGFFRETYKASAFAAHGIAATVVQENHSHSTRGVLRGLHYQSAPHAQGKLVSVTVGEVFDVAVDLRRASPTFGRWVGATLSAENARLLWIPPGFAHGFCVLSDAADMLYKVTHAEYAPQCDRGILWNDPAIGIAWPVVDPTLSAKDAQLPLLKDAEAF